MLISVYIYIYVLYIWKKIRAMTPEWMYLCVCRSLEYLDCVHGLFSLLLALIVAPGRRRNKCWRGQTYLGGNVSTEEAGLETPMETKSRLKVTPGRDPGLPPSASSVERASPPRLSSPGLHTALGKQISNCLSVMLHDLHASHHPSKHSCHHQYYC